MGVKGFTWVLKWSGGTAYACFELGIQESTRETYELILIWTEAKPNFPVSQRTLSRKRVPKEHPCREISAHDDHMETPNYDIEQALGRYVASSGKCRFSFGMQAKQRLTLYEFQSLSAVLYRVVVMYGEIENIPV
ncbi:hypothetical protein PIB30_051205 [Stylosanthes scabra]|uniref:Uncharacterized protein n=1 Tax=Stylosanthes scabra TaxID=79078 RepID=A0ABU6ZGP0_9FABA|nr:hypothetical protein [Stylosanthes scabra]